MGRPSDEEVILSLVPANGEAVGNVTLLRQLAQQGWGEDKFWRVRDKLLSEGTLIKGRGKGGSVRRTDSPASETPSSLPDVVPKAGSEAALYDPLLKVLESEWVRAVQIEPRFILRSPRVLEEKRQAESGAGPTLRR